MRQRKRQSTPDQYQGSLTASALRETQDGNTVAWKGSTVRGGKGLNIHAANTLSLDAFTGRSTASLASQAAISLINNQGNVGKTLKEMGSSRVVKSTIAAALTAGVLEKLGGTSFMSGLNTATATLTEKVTYNLINASTRSLISAGVTGENLTDALKMGLLQGLVDTAHGEVASKIKVLEGDYIVHKLAHALAGCAAGAAAGGACKDGAIGAAVAEMTAELFANQKPGAYASDADVDAYNKKVKGYSQLVAGTTTALAGGNAQTAINAASVAVSNNFLTFDENQLRKQATEACKTGNAQACADEKRWDTLDLNRDNQVKKACSTDAGSASCKDWRDFALLARTSYMQNGLSGSEVALDHLRSGRFADIQELQSIQKLLNNTPYSYLSHAPQSIQMLAGLVADFLPLVGDVKAFQDAKDPFDYAIAVIGAVGGPAGDAAAKAIKAAKVAHDAGNTAEAVAQIQNAEKLIQANVGRTGSWSTGINGKLDTHAKYQLNNGHIYNTDGLGRVKSVEGDLSLTVMDRNKYQQCITGKCGEIGDQGGHLIAATLGGAGDRINLVPQAATLNNGEWKTMENYFKAALAEGKKVSVNIEVGYPAGNGVRPSSFKVVADVGGVEKKFTFNQ